MGAGEEEGAHGSYGRVRCGPHPSHMPVYRKGDAGLCSSVVEYLQGTREVCALATHTEGGLTASGFRRFLMVLGISQDSSGREAYPSCGTYYCCRVLPWALSP